MWRHIDLPQWRIVSVAGPERHAFLQGQLTQDVGRIVEHQTCLAGWADARGRLLWAGHAFALPERICLLAPAETAASLALRLKLFVLRARAEVGVADLPLAGLASDDPADPLPTMNGWRPLRLAGDPSRRLLVAETPARPAGAAVHSTSTDWARRDVRTGIPCILPAVAGEFVPQMVNLDLLDAISFTKGCYTGQEIVARTRYLGRIKRRMLRFAAPGEAPAPGSAVYGPGGVLGQVVTGAAAGNGTELLAVMRLDEIRATALYLDEPGGRELSRLALPYAIPEADPGSG